MNWLTSNQERFAMLLVIAMVGAGVSTMAVGAVYVLVNLAH